MSADESVSVPQPESEEAPDPPEEHEIASAEKLNSDNVEESEQHFPQDEEESNIVDNVNENSGDDPLNSRSDADGNEEGEDKAEDDSRDAITKLMSFEQMNNESSNEKENDISNPSSNKSENNDKQPSTDDGDRNNSKTSEDKEDTNSDKKASDDDEPNFIRMDKKIFEEEEEDDEVMEVAAEDSQCDDPPDIGSMLQMSFREDGQDEGKQNADADESAEPHDSSTVEDGNEESPSRRPRRAAAQLAAHNIREISHNEVETLDDRFKKRGRSKDDDDVLYDDEAEQAGSYTRVQKFHKCSTCKTSAVCNIKVQQYGTEVYFCSDKCFSKQRSQNSATGRMACSKCGLSNLHLDTDKAVYWETMNFCSELCVGNYQVEVGEKCVTCSNNVPWLSLGKYCVRFGSDIRQFCCVDCLDGYKKTARVCFYCQLDIKRLGNVILVNLPGKPTPKEFCSQDCVEMYVEQNSKQLAKSKSQNHTCVICGELKLLFKELVLDNDKSGSHSSFNSLNLKCCSDLCWKKLLEAQRVVNPMKCDTCTKFINLDFSCDPPTNYVSTDEKVYCFCSPTCKNVFVLKHRHIIICVTCKVKKYNYDLMQFYQGHAFKYAACSLNCLPNTLQHIENLRSQISKANGGTLDTNPAMEIVPVINSVSSISDHHQNTFMNQPILLDASGNVVSIGSDGTYSVAVQDGSGIDVSQFLQMNANGEFVVNASTGADFELDEVDLEDWDGFVKFQDVEELLAEHWRCPEMKTKYTMAKPKSQTISTQTEESAIMEMGRIPLKTVEKIKYVPFPMPIPVFIPVPTYLLETPIPYPFPVPIPLPVPIPIILNYNESKSSNLLQSNTCEATNDNEVDMTDISLEIVKDKLDQESDITLNKTPSEITLLCSDTNLQNGSNISNRPSSIISAETNSPSVESEQNAGNLNTATNTLAVKEIVSTPSTATSSPVRKKLTRVEYGIRAWKMSYGPFSDPVKCESTELSGKLADWVNKGTKPTGERYRADIITYLCLGVQQHLKENGRTDNIFYDSVYNPFVTAITNYAESDCAQGINTRIEDNHFWESQQLGDDSPGVLLFTIIYMFYKNFHLKTWEKHTALKFDQIKLETKIHPGLSTAMNCITIVDTPECKGIQVFEHIDSTERCPVRLLKDYISKCDKNYGSFYKTINLKYRETGSWYTNEPLDQMQIYQMLVRAMMIKSDS